MNDIVIVNFDESPAKLFSVISKRKKRPLYIFLNNGLSKENTDRIRELTDKNKNIGVDSILLEYSCEKPIVEVVNNGFAFALNFQDASTISYVDSAIDGKQMDEMVETVSLREIVACGGKPITSPLHHGLNYETSGEIIRANHQVSWSIRQPWTLDVQKLREMMKSALAFNAFNNGIGVCFSKELNFEALFASLNKATKFAGGFKIAASIS